MFINFFHNQYFLYNFCLIAGVGNKFTYFENGTEQKWPAVGQYKRIFSLCKLGLPSFRYPSWLKMGQRIKAIYIPFSEPHSFPKIKFGPYFACTHAKIVYYIIKYFRSNRWLYCTNSWNIFENQFLLLGLFVSSEY